MSQSVKQAKFTFDKPFASDWAFYIFLLIAFSNVSSSLKTYGGLGNLTNAGMFAFAIDAAFALAFSYVETWIIILLPRKFIRQSRQKES